MITIPGQLAIRTIHGRNGPFNVGHLVTSIGNFVIKNAELDQYKEGKYDGEFIVTAIKPSMYSSNSGAIVIDNRAYLGGMTLSSTEQLSEQDASQFSPQVADPLDEEVPDASTPPYPDDLPETSAVLQSTSTPRSVSDVSPTGGLDEKLFGALWPLGDVVKLDSTVSRSELRAQCKRLGHLGYTFNEIAQEWHLAVAA